MDTIKYALIGSILFGAICAFGAKRKGRNPIGWFALGFAFGIFGLVILTFMPAKQGDQLAMAPLPPLFPTESALREKIWYYLSDEREQKGPMSYDALQRAYHEERVKGETLLWNDEMEDWTPLSSIDE